MEQDDGKAESRIARKLFCGAVWSITALLFAGLTALTIAGVGLLVYGYVYFRSTLLHVVASHKHSAGRTVPVIVAISVLVPVVSHGLSWLLRHQLQKAELRAADDEEASVADPEQRCRP